MANAPGLGPNGAAVDFYLSPSGFDKVTCAAPCAGFMVRAINDEKDKVQPILRCDVSKSETLKFTVASLAFQTGCKL